MYVHALNIPSVNTLLLIRKIKFKNIFFKKTEYCVCCWWPFYRKDIETLVQVQRTAMRMTEALETKFYDGKLKGLGMFNLERKKLREDAVSIWRAFCISG